MNALVADDGNLVVPRASTSDALRFFQKRGTWICFTLELLQITCFRQFPTLPDLSLLFPFSKAAGFTVHGSPIGSRTYLTEFLESRQRDMVASSPACGISMTHSWPTARIDSVLVPESLSICCERSSQINELPWLSASTGSSGTCPLRSMALALPELRAKHLFRSRKWPRLTTRPRYCQGRINGLCNRRFGRFSNIFHFPHDQSLGTAQIRHFVVDVTASNAVFRPKLNCLFRALTYPGQ